MQNRVKNIVLIPPPPQVWLIHINLKGLKNNFDF